MVRRPLIYVAISTLSAIFICYASNVFIAFVPIVYLVIKADVRHKQICVILFFYIFSFINFQLHENRVYEIGRYIDVNAEYEGEISGIQYKKNANGDEYIQAKVKVNCINNTILNKEEKVLIRLYENINTIKKTAYPGLKIEFKGKAELPDEQRNPYGFNYSLYLKSVDIKHIIVADNFKAHISNGNAIKSTKRTLYFLKEDYLSEITKKFGEETAAFTRAMLFGDKSLLDESIKEEFQKNGTAHVLAVSGLHIGIIYVFISKIWVFKKNKIYFIFIMIFLFAYTFLADFSPSVVRAVLMIGMHIYANLTNRRYDIISASIIVMLPAIFFNPYCIFNTGMQMSYIAVISIAMIMPLIKKKYNGVFLSGLSVQLGILPYSIYTFNCLPAAAIVINIPMVFLSGLIVPVGIISMFTFIISEPLFSVLSIVMYGLSEIAITINSMTCIESISYFDLPGPPLWGIVLFYLILSFSLSEEGRLLIIRKKYNIIFRCFILIIVITAAVCTFAGNPLNKSDIIFVDVGQGDCIHFKVNNKNYLVDGGGTIQYNIGKNTLKPYLLKTGVSKIDGAFVTHLHTDHYKGIVELCREGMIKKLYLYESNIIKKESILKETNLKEENVCFLHEGDKVIFDKSSWIEVLWPERKTMKEYHEICADESDENMASLIMRINVNGISVMATGDVDEKCLEELSRKYGHDLEADILKVPHHGSKYSYSESFTEYVSSTYAVFQVGRNNFGHPDKGVVENYRQKGIIIYRNDRSGAIGFRLSKNGEISAFTMIERH